jgi:hypothetical protein
VFKRRDHATEDVFYVDPRGSLNLPTFPTMHRLGLYVADAEAVNAISLKQPSTSNEKTDTVDSQKNSFPDIWRRGSASAQ